jgi:hypothetical protein
MLPTLTLPATPLAAAKTEVGDAAFAAAAFKAFVPGTADFNAPNDVGSFIPPSISIIRCYIL